MSAKPNRILTAAQVRERDRCAIEDHGVPGYTLMCRAGDAVLEALRESWPAARRIVIFCGAGNNAGDGFVVGRLARESGLHVRLLCLGSPDALTGDAATAWEDYRSTGGEAADYAEAPVDELLREGQVVVDAILGTGVQRPLEGSYAAAVLAINASERPVLAVDLPSGISADTGEVLGCAVRADVTVTFVGLKIGCYLAAGPAYCGRIEFDDLGTRDLLGLETAFAARRLHRGVIGAALPARARDAHKGSHGHVLMIGGSEGMSGAVRLAAEAALRAGAGLVTVATSPATAAVVAAARPEWMCVGVAGAAGLGRLLDRASVLAIGPGLGQDAWARELLDTVLASPLPKLLDADALNLLGASDSNGQIDGPCIITPHPGEAARLLGAEVADIQRQRLESVLALAARYRAVAVLKGAATLVAVEDEPVWVCDRGNPGMAVGGMGDLLSGIISGVLAQCPDPAHAARAGVLVHALAGDDMAATGERGILASDLMERIRYWVNPA